MTCSSCREWTPEPGQGMQTLQTGAVVPLWGTCARGRHSTPWMALPTQAQYRHRAAAACEDYNPPRQTELWALEVTR